MKKLNAILNYDNKNLIQTIMQKMGMTEIEAKNALRDTLKFLYLCATVKKLFAPPQVIDEVWHLFILSTEDYAKFCENYFGFFVHHRPAINGIVPGVDEDLEILHYNTLNEAKKLSELLGEKKLSKNFTSGVNSFDWCCGDFPTPAPKPQPKPAEEVSYATRN